MTNFFHKTQRDHDSPFTPLVSLSIAILQLKPCNIATQENVRLDTQPIVTKH